jgi:hypothetical protein
MTSLQGSTLHSKLFCLVLCFGFILGNFSPAPRGAHQAKILKEKERVTLRSKTMACVHCASDDAIKMNKTIHELPKKVLEYFSIVP